MNSKPQNKEYWESFANNKKRLIVYHGPDVIDLTGFAPQHPGGFKAISVYRLKDIKNILFRVYPHPNSVLKILSKHKCGQLAGFEQNEKQSPNSLRKGICYVAKPKQKKQKGGQKNVCFASENKQSPTQKKTVSHQSQKASNFGPYVGESEIDFEDQKPELRVPLFQIRMGRTDDSNSYSLQTEPLEEILDL